MEIASTSTEVDLRRCVLWQYDRAPNLLSIFSGMDKIVSVSTDEFWQEYIASVLDVDSATGEPPAGHDSPFRGLDTLGRIIGVQRPTAWDGTTASDDFYRRLLKAHLFLSFADASSASIGKYLVMVFGARRQIDIEELDPAVGDTVVIGGIEYTFISSASKYGAENEVKIVTTAGGAVDYAETAKNLAAIVNGEEDAGFAGQKPNPNVSENGASAAGGVVTLEYEYWYADGKPATAKVVVADNANMTIDYRLPSPTLAPQIFTPEEMSFVSPYHSDTGVLMGGKILGYTLSGERIIGFYDADDGRYVMNPAYPVIFPFPSGVCSPGFGPGDKFSPLGLNETEGTGQNRANLVFDESQPNGAPYSGNGS